MSHGRAGDRLSDFHAKRDFAKTPEPRGEARSPHADGAPRFVIHEHSARRMHWDLRLEHDGVLVSWALPRGLPERPKVNHIAPHTEDHPLEYLDFEAEIPKGQYGAGTIRIWDRGTYELLKWEPRKVEVELHGERARGRYALFAIGEDTKDWMIHRMDAAPEPAQPMPDRIVPMLAAAAPLPAREHEWAFEVKWDGVRAIAYCEPGSVRLRSRTLLEVTARYPELARLGRALSTHRVILDGEIVALDAAGRPSFAMLAARMNASESRARALAQRSPVTYAIFDLLWLDGRSLLDDPYDERRAALDALGLDGGEHWRISTALAGSGRAVLAATRAQRLEGVVAKRRDSRYEPGRRSGAWVKVRHLERRALVIGGFTAGQGGRRERIGALLLGAHARSGQLRYAGRVGSGLAERELAALAAALAPLVRPDSPFDPDGPRPPRGAVFCEPRLVCEVEFSQWTREGLLRQPSFVAIADGVAPESVVHDGDGSRDEAAGAAVVLSGESPLRAQVIAGGQHLSLSNPEKVLYPARSTTKRDVLEYYAQVAPVLLVHLADRPLTVTRYPDGVDGKAFFEKQSPAHRPEWVRTFAVPSARRATIDFTLANDLPTLVWLANLAALELHVPLHRAPDLGRPDAVVFDLDPGEPATIVECCRVALWLEGTFERLGLRSFPKTSGSKGLAVYVPLGGTHVTYERTKTFARAVAELVERAEPGLAVSRMTRSLRAGRVLIDWSQNDPHKTTICAYSLRARERPTVSTPLEWDEVRAALRAGDPQALAFEWPAVLERVASRGDLFAGVLSVAQELPAL